MRSLFLKTFLLFWLTLMLVYVGSTLLVVYLYSGPARRPHVSVLLLPGNLHFLMISFITGGIFCYWSARRLTAPLSKLGAAASELADGRLEARVGPALAKRRDEIGALGRDFDYMAGRIEALVRGQQRLLGDVSHELRSPLARLTVALGLAQRGPREEMPEHLERIRAEAGRLDKLIGQLLTLARIDTRVDEKTRSPLDLTGLVLEIVADGEFEARASSRSVQVIAADPCSISGSEDMLRSAIENVVRNAIRHTREGTAVEISLRTAGAHAVLSVRDHGSGVAESMLSEIFLPFRRAGACAGEGAGLGLAITARAVGVHGGTVTASNAPGGGLIVRIELPLA